MNVLISACLLGCACRYDGASKPLDGGVLDALRERFTLIPVCPESYGGLPCPRAPSERRGGAVVSSEGGDVTAQFAKGAREALRIARLTDAKLALLKERSPSCGHGEIYDGTFSGTLVGGSGVTAELLAQNGIEVIGESKITELLEGKFDEN
ncbi:MAG: DUF523 domain-containing protein [Oscillospiraceae bacterium]|nr:DUF523 domain-containing protein [Oscillospiraceae bacterium]